MTASAVARTAGLQPTTGGLRRVIGSATALATGRGIAMALSAVWLVIAARHLSLDDFGNLSLLLATSGILISVSDRGLQSALAIHVAAEGRMDRDTLWLVVRKRLPFALACSAVNVGLYLAVASSGSVWPPLIATGTIVGTSVYGTLLAAYRCLGRVRVDALNETISRAAVLGVGGWWLAHGGGLLGAVACYATADVASAVAVGLVISRMTEGAELSCGRLDVRFRSTLPLAMLMILGVVYYRLDTYLIGALRGSGEAGLYAAGYRFLDLASLLPLAVGSLILSHTARLNGQERLTTLRALARISVLAGVPVTVAGALVAGRMVTFAFGTSFTNAGPMTALLLLGIVPTAFVGAALPVIVNEGRRRAVEVTGATLVINLVGNLVAIPVAGGRGAAVVNLVSQLVLALCVYRMGLTQAIPAPPVAPGVHVAEKGQRVGVSPA